MQAAAAAAVMEALLAAAAQVVAVQVQIPVLLLLPVQQIPAGEGVVDQQKILLSVAQAVPAS